MRILMIEGVFLDMSCGIMVPSKDERTEDMIMMYAATEIFNESRIDGNRQRRIEQILSLLPRSAATEGEWKLRRRAIAPELVREIDRYCREHGFIYFVSHTLELVG